MNFKWWKPVRKSMAEELYKIKVPATALSSPIFMKELGRRCSLSYSYEIENTDFETHERLVFDGVEAFRCTHYTANSLEVFDAYGRVVEITRSTWLKEIIQNLTRAGTELGTLKHLRVYFDDGPCYEFICRSFDVITEEDCAEP